jgi:hypothetical protein
MDALEASGVGLLSDGQPGVAGPPKGIEKIRRPLPRN